MPKALRFRQWKTPKQAGERARLKVVHGPDSGSLYVVTSERFTIGRGDENDVVFADLRASRRHAELTRLPTGRWQLRDLGSQNGFVCNGTVTREAELKAGDIVTVGETAFEFVPEESGTQLLFSPPKALAPELLAGRYAAPAVVSTPAPAFTVTRPAAPSAAGMEGVAGFGAAVGGASGGEGKRKKIIIAAVVLMGIWTYLDETGTAPSPERAKRLAEKKAALEKKTQTERDLASYLPPVPATGPMASAETFFQEGFREFRERNFLRSRLQFETALQINPGHSSARNYLAQADRAIEEEVLAHLHRGRRDFDSGKLRGAKGHFEAVLRLLQRDPESPPYREAREQLKDVRSLLGSRKGGES